MSAYATFNEFTEYGLPQRSIGDQDMDRVLKAITAASRTVDSYLAPRYPVPLTQWPEIVTRHTCSIAVWFYLGNRGFQTEGPDEIIRIAYEDAIKWCKDVAAGRATIIGIAADGTSPVPQAAPTAVIDSEPLRGW